MYPKKRVQFFIVTVIIIVMSLPNTLNDEARFAKTGKKGGWHLKKNSKYYLSSRLRNIFSKKWKYFNEKWKHYLSSSLKSKFAIPLCFLFTIRNLFVLIQVSFFLHSFSFIHNFSTQCLISYGFVQFVPCQYWQFLLSCKKDYLSQSLAHACRPNFNPKMFQKEGNILISC